MLRTRILMMLGVVALAAFAAGCGSSSSGSTGSTGSAASSAPNFRTAAGRAQLAACLKKQGVTLPRRPQGGAPPAGAGPGAGGGGGGFLFGGGAGNGGPPGGFQSSKFAAALRRCGVTPQAGRFRGGATGRLNSTRFKQALTKFVACMKKNGYALPKPNTSGNGPVFDASKVNRNSPKFKVAAANCQSLLRFGPPPSAAPPASG